MEVWCVGNNHQWCFFGNLASFITPIFWWTCHNVWSSLSENWNNSFGKRCFLVWLWIDNLRQSLDIGDCTTCRWWKLKSYRDSFTLTLVLLCHKELTVCMALYWFLADTNLQTSFFVFHPIFPKIDLENFLHLDSSECPVFSHPEYCCL